MAQQKSKMKSKDMTVLISIMIKQQLHYVDHIYFTRNRTVNVVAEH
jgi:hypothetical protein